MVLIAVMLAMLMVVFALISGLGRLCRLSPEDRSVLFFCGSTESLASGLLIAAALFPAETAGATVLPVLINHMAQFDQWTQNCANQDGRNMASCSPGNIADNTESDDVPADSLIAFVKSLSSTVRPACRALRFSPRSPLGAAC